MRALVTGATGFVGRYLVAALRGRRRRRCSSAAARDDGPAPFALDLDDPAIGRGRIDLARPDVVFHLAAQTFVPASFAVAGRDLSHQRHRHGEPRIARFASTRAAGAMPRIVFTSSAEVYGAVRRATCRCANCRGRARNTVCREQVRRRSNLARRSARVRTGRRGRARVQPYRPRAERAFRGAELRAQLARSPPARNRR